MSFLNVAECKKFVHDNNKQLSKDAIEALSYRVQAILTSAISQSGRFTRITACEIQHSK
jgi:hypothetical protein